MKKFYCLAVAVVCVVSIAAFANQGTSLDFAHPDLDPELKGQTADLGLVDAIKTEGIGHHTVFLSVSIPDEGCDLADRAIILGTLDQGGALLETAMTALVHTKRVRVNVNGCVMLRPTESTTAPLVERIFIRR